MTRKETKEYFEKEKDYHQVAMMEFTDLLKSEHNLDGDKIPACFYDVLGIVLSKFKERIINSETSHNSSSKKDCYKRCNARSSFINEPYLNCNVYGCEDRQRSPS